MSYASTLTRQLELKRTRRKVERRYRANKHRSVTSTEKPEEDKSLITDFSQVRKAIKKRKRREVITTTIALVVSITILFLLATVVDWGWVIRNILEKP
ncbi:hypothetical protein EAX61_15010 [Dokdonia sinensis]|uniref:Uncharacterized protein n=1 Tax=Dokdonia sinensis TaxID=2479847 RepID=A0A3M0FWB6_9FLAO|nr:hypothetical protein [Dokdonia sinensis]RMB56267.1 hypothetical protein EAX61_15010 [Dokdonia sinensis]